MKKYKFHNRNQNILILVYFNLKWIFEWQSLKSEKKSGPVNDISEAVRWDGVGSGICLFHIQAEFNALNFVFLKRQKNDQKHLQQSTSTWSIF